MTETNNNSKSFIFHPKRLIALVVLFLIVRITMAHLLPKTASGNDLTVANIISSINKERSLRNLTTLNQNQLLMIAAQYKSDDMQARHYFAHVDPDGHYIWDKIVALGYTPYLQLGENLAIEFSDTDSLVSAWMNSPEHRANILNSGFVDQGMGLNLGNVQQGQYSSAITNVFGTLLVNKQAQAAPPPAGGSTPATKPAVKPAATTASAPAATKMPASNTAPTTSTSAVVHTPLAIREGSGEKSFSLAPQNQTTSSNPLSTGTAEGLVGNTSSKNGLATANRDLTVLFALALVLLLGSEAWEHYKKNGGHLDKKTNNLVLLVLAIIVVAYLYWK